MSTRLGDTVTTRRPRSTTLLALGLAFAVLAALLTANVHAAPSAEAKGPVYVANSSKSQERIKVRTVQTVRSCPLGSKTCKVGSRKTTDVWVYPGGDTGKGRVVYGTATGVWLPKNCRTRHSSRPGQPTKGGYNAVTGPGTFTVTRC